MDVALFFIVFTPLVIAGFTLYAVFVARLRVLYPEVWRSLGEPNLVLTNSRKSFETAKYIVKGSFRHLDNRQFVRFCKLVRFFAIAYAVGFIFLLTSSLAWGLYQSSHPK